MITFLSKQKTIEKNTRGATLDHLASALASLLAGRCADAAHVAEVRAARVDAGGGGVTGGNPVGMPC